MTIIVAKCGFNRNTKREILYGSQAYGGANFRHLYMHQGVGQITTFMRHWRQANTIPGKLLKCAVAWTQMTAGTSYSIFQRVHTGLPHLESKWFVSVRNFMAQINASFELDNSGVPPIERQNDSHIMDAILESNRFTDTQIRRLNYCRLTLQAVTVSDLSDATGRKLDPSKLQGVPSDRSSTTTWLHVNQDRPSEEEWRLWRQANLLWSSPDGVLNHQLGSWLHPRAQQRQQHFAYLQRRRLYIRVGTTAYQVCKPTQNPGEYRFTTRVQQLMTLITAYPVEVTASRLNQDNWSVNQTQHSILAQAALARAATFADFVNTLDPWEMDVLRMTTMHVNPHALCAALSHGFRAASDGSVRFMTQGAFGWTLSTEQGFQAATGIGPARGPRPSSYRAEGYGLLSLLSFLIRVAEFTGHVDAWKGVIVTDSQSILRTLGGGDTPVDATEEPVSIDGDDVVLDVLCPDWDILIEIQEALTQLPDLQLKFVKGHQDDKIPYAQLPLLARLNVDADALAGRFQDLHGQDRPMALITARTGVQLHLIDGTVTSSHAATLRHAYSGPPLLEALRIRNAWSEATVASVNWQPMEVRFGNKCPVGSITSS